MPDLPDFKNPQETQATPQMNVSGVLEPKSGDLTKPESQQKHDSGSDGFSFAESARSLAYSAFQKPITGVAQWVDKGLGTSLADSTQIINQPKEATFGSVQWHVDQVASGVGAFVPYVAAMALTRGALKTVGAENVITLAGHNAGAAASIYRTSEAAAAGFVNGMVFEPTSDQNNFFGDRVRQGIVGGVNFGTMHAISNPLSRLTGASTLEASLLNRASTTAAAGVAGGIAASVTDSALSGKSIDTTDLAKTAYQSAFTGLALGAGADHFLRLHQPKSSFPEAQAFVSRPNIMADNSAAYMLWHDQQSFSGTLGLAAKAVNARLQGRPIDDLNFFGRSPLNRVELVADFERRGDAFFTKPKTLTEIHSIVEKQTDLNELANRIMDESERTYGNWEKPNWMDFTQTERLSSEEHKTATENIAKLEKELDEATNERTRTFAQDINNFLEKNNLPRIDLITDSESGNLGWLKPGGQLGIRDYLLNAHDIDFRAVDTLVHELTHLRQDTLTVRRLADEMQIGKEATQEQLEQLATKYMERWTDPSRDQTAPQSQNESSIPQLTGERLEEYLQNILRIRDGKPLTQEELVDAKAIDTNQWTNARESLKISNQKDAVGRFASSTMPLVSFDKLFYDIVKEPSKFQTETGFESIPEPLLNFAKKHLNENFDPSKPHDVIDDVYDPYSHLDEWNSTIKPLFVEQEKKLTDQLTRKMDKSFDLYYGDPGERTAHPTGRLAGFAYEGATSFSYLHALKFLAMDLKSRAKEKLSTWSN
ncbi:MAG TPA: hypothetical protein V6C76_12775 [Drouetiella sp.]